MKMVVVVVVRLMMITMMMQVDSCWYDWVQRTLKHVENYLVYLIGTWEKKHDVVFCWRVKVDFSCFGSSPVDRILAMPSPLPHLFGFLPRPWVVHPHRQAIIKQINIMHVIWNTKSYRCGLFSSGISCCVFLCTNSKSWIIELVFTSL